MEPNDKTISLFTALTTAAATAFALEYMIHAEWGLHRVAIREDALGAAGVLIVLLGLKAIFARKKKGP
jgi:hypothetical protein